MPETISLEHAVWRNTLMPATVHGIDGRGVLREGAWADVLVIDPARLEARRARCCADAKQGRQESSLAFTTRVEGRTSITSGPTQRTPTVPRV